MALENLEFKDQIGLQGEEKNVKGEKKRRGRGRRRRGRGDQAKKVWKLP